MKTFIHLVKKYLDRKKVAYTIDEDAIIAEGGEWPGQMGISNLAKICKQDPRSTIQWNKTNEELYETGLANIRMKYTEKFYAEDVNAIKIWFIEGDHLFVTNNVLYLHLLSVPSSAYGSLVGIPNRHVVVIYPIEDLGVVDALHPFISILEGLYNEGPGSISQKLYWHRDGQLLNLPYSLSDNNLEFKPPEEFVAVMNLLQAKK
jgi:hypothetical protein